MDDAQAEVLRHVTSVLESGEARLYEQVASTFKWLLGTLFAANGGALVALLGNESFADRLPTLSLAFFGTGLVCSVLMAVANAVYAEKALLPTTDLRMTLACFAVGQATFDEVQKKMSALDAAKWLKWPLYGSGLLSFSCLVGGMISFACTSGR